MGLILMFSLLAFNPSGTSWFNWLHTFLSVPSGTEQSAGIANATIKMETTQKKQSLALGSPMFSNGSTTIPARYTCDGVNISPPLSISGVPSKTQSLVLIMDDPDAPGGTWDHWVVFDIPPTVRTISEGKEPPGRSGKNSWGKTGYGGPCPPKGEHRYVFQLYALSHVLALPAGSTKAAVLTEMKGYVLAQTELTARYKRKTK